MNAATTLHETVLPVAEAARRLAVTPGRVRQLVVEGRIAARRFGSVLAIPEAEVTRYARERRSYQRNS